MDGAGFDRMTQVLIRQSGRRQTLRSLLGGALLAAAAPLGLEAAQKKKRWRKLSQLCTSTGPTRCCTRRALPLACEEATKRACPTGKRCCTSEGYACSPLHGDCDCCGSLHCGFIPHLGWRCLRPPRESGQDEPLLPAP
jgi:hypothetical protein